MTNPTAGGVTASFAGLGDILIGEPKSVLAFAAAELYKIHKRRTTREEFQTAEFVKDHGGIDLSSGEKISKVYVISTLLSILLKKKKVRLYQKL